MHYVLGKEKSKVLLLGNEAIVRGALESGVGLASTYPGTPSSEIGSTFAKVAKDAGIYFEYSTNEKVAFEVSAAAALSGVRSMTFFKHYGLNVASDSVLPMAYLGVKAGMVIVVTDDPSCHSSVQGEEDTRYFARLAHLPMLEPTDAQDCVNVVKEAYKISESVNLPVFVRTTTRVSHMRGIVEYNKIVKGETKGKFNKGASKKASPALVLEEHKNLHEKLEKLKKASEKSKLNFMINENTKSDIGIIVSGVSYNYLMDALTDLGLELPVLKLGFTYPMPDGLVEKFIGKYKKVLIVEELETLVEEHVKLLAKETKPDLIVMGKGDDLFPQQGEYNEEIIVNVLCKVFGKKYKFDLNSHASEYQKIKVIKRSPLFCAGCPHRATFYAVKQATKGMDVVYGGDIGCYLLGTFKPYEEQDFSISMGASIGICHGVKKATNQKAIAFVGDSTFFHASMPGIVNAVYNKSNILVIILDNRITAMTGHQNNPSTGITAMGEETKHLKIEDIVKAMGVEDVRVVDPFNVNLMTKSVKEMLENKTVSVLIAKRDCQLLVMRERKRKGTKTVKFEIDETKCKNIRECLKGLACPAIMEKNGKIIIDRNLCTGCSVCSQICPAKAIKPVIEK